MDRGALSAAGGAIPFAGGLLFAAAGVWSDTEQARAMETLRAWIKMLEDELQEKQLTILDIIARLDMHDEQINERVKSIEISRFSRRRSGVGRDREHQEAGIYPEDSTNAAAPIRLVSDDVVSPLSIGYRITRSSISPSLASYINAQALPAPKSGTTWVKVRSEKTWPEADLFKLLVRDLSTGGIIRQHREPTKQGTTSPSAKHVVLQGCYPDDEVRLR